MTLMQEKFGARLKEIRKAKNLTQEQLAEKINMETPNLCKLENGNHFPQAKNLEKIALALDVEIKDLFDYEHINSKQKLIQNIQKMLNELTFSEIKFLYKTIQNLKNINSKSE